MCIRALFRIHPSAGQGESDRMACLSDISSTHRALPFTGTLSHTLCTRVVPGVPLQYRSTGYDGPCQELGIHQHTHAGWDTCCMMSPRAFLNLAGYNMGRNCTSAGELGIIFIAMCIFLLENVVTMFGSQESWPWPEAWESCGPLVFITCGKATKHNISVIRLNRGYTSHPLY